MSGFDQARFREVLGHFATGITIVTATEEGEPVGFSCQSFAALSLDPPMVILARPRAPPAGPALPRPDRFA
jgi:3-hydroxy-9,10-secoandrosta-1,3,5(10)-triene-9,17-dione monooxygenase reductase component